MLNLHCHRLVPIQGVKLRGLGKRNVVIAMYSMGEKSALAISVLCELLCHHCCSEDFPDFYTALPVVALASFSAMCIVKRNKSGSIIGVSISRRYISQYSTDNGCGSCVEYKRCILLSSGYSAYLGVITGIIIGLIPEYCLAHIEKAGNKILVCIQAVSSHKL